MAPVQKVDLGAGRVLGERQCPLGPEDLIMADVLSRYRSTGQPGRSDRGGEGPEFFGDGGVCPGQRAQRHFSRTRIQVALKLTPD